MSDLHDPTDVPTFLFELAAMRELDQRLRERLADPEARERLAALDHAARAFLESVRAFREHFERSAPPVLRIRAPDE